VSTSRQTYAEMLSAVSTDTTLPLVLNFLRCSPSWPTSEKNCLFPDCSEHTTARTRAKVIHTLLAPKEADEENTSPKHGKEGSNRVEFGGEDFEHNQGKRELPNSCANISASKRALGCANLDEFGAGQHDGAGAVFAQLVVLHGMAALEEVNFRSAWWVSLLTSNMVVTHWSVGVIASCM
jgi:hypothetical protein